MTDQEVLKQDDPLFNLKSKWSYGKKLFRELEAEQQGSKTFVISFSRGKDSIALALALREAGYDLAPFYLETVPGLSFVEESLDYYERSLFGRHIVRALHPAFAMQLQEGVFHPPHLLAIDDAMDFGGYDYHMVQQMVIDQEGLNELTWTAVGTRASDSVMRRKNIAIKGPKAYGKRSFQGIWEYNMDMIVEVISKSGLKLPADYRFMGKSLDGLQGEFVAPIKKHYPEDYRKLLEFFPLLDIEVFYYERAHGAL